MNVYVVMENGCELRGVYFSRELAVRFIEELREYDEKYDEGYEHAGSSFSIFRCEIDDTMPMPRDVTEMVPA